VQLTENGKYLGSVRMKDPTRLLEKREGSECGREIGHEHAPPGF